MDFCLGKIEKPDNFIIVGGQMEIKEMKIPVMVNQ